jgi:DNA-binding beta-propeller fold protein YncE
MRFAFTWILAVWVGAPSPLAAEVGVVTRFDAAAGEHAENVVIAADGTVYVTLLSGGLYVRSPGGGERRLKLAGAHASLTGLSIDRRGGVLVGVDRRGGDGPKGVWRFDPITGGSEQVVSLPASVMVNGVAVDPAGRIYVADSHGVVWRTGGAHAVARRWLTGSAVAPRARQAIVDGRPGPMLTVGPNGLKVNGGLLYVSVSGQATIIAVAIGRRPGRLRTVASGVFVDDLAFDRDGRLLITSDTTQVLTTGIERIERLGERTVLAAASDRLQQPSAIAVDPRTGNLLVTTLGLFGEPQLPALQTLRQ